MTIEAMKQALRELEGIPFYRKYGVRISNAITALRTAIEQAEKQEPRCAVIVEVFGKDWRLDYMSLPVGKHRLYTQEYVYTTPPAAQQEPVWDASAPIVMTPHPAFAKRTWVGLTEGERDQFYKYVTMPDLVKAIEARLKEKNNG
jgi:hypothetical protein